MKNQTNLTQANDIEVQSLVALCKTNSVLRILLSRQSLGVAGCLFAEFCREQKNKLTSAMGGFLDGLNPGLG
jgi:hypothetical protein